MQCIHRSPTHRDKVRESPLLSNVRSAQLLHGCEIASTLTLILLGLKAAMHHKASDLRLVVAVALLVLVVHTIERNLPSILFRLRGGPPIWPRGKSGPCSPH
jgi:hypothetical protein